MKIKVDPDMLLSIAEAVKKLPIDCKDFDTADRWVGCVLALQNIVSTSESVDEEVVDDGR